MLDFIEGSDATSAERKGFEIWQLFPNYGLVREFPRLTERRPMPPCLMPLQHPYREIWSLKDRALHRWVRGVMPWRLCYRDAHASSDRKTFE
ncbi:hypothetical protein AVEN_261701-1 [Araneus ventricosus]|uniref:Uncharacterized protein n=1 Tax=Araneus ventricosus TaxID=182803 RepID=A0A4Y2DXP1_ARAVE|nr:hypothetical protein AVEN_261701-1 [Araneus ventricosus]